MKKLSPLLAGIAGEYYVAAELSRRGYIASLTLRNTKGIDILASNAGATRTVGLQVKTTQGKKNEWLLNKKIESEEATNLFFIFVKINDSEAPSFHIVPANSVIDYSTTNHQKWLKEPSKKGEKHNDNSMRKFRDIENKYLNKWEKLGLD